eukprot:CAMPEP_0198556692 /NCGR_PEP_ID=MMETSP1462-20131121/87235_1 /TAXON_ID=1333877 /ORGANISM="Brandtodinium nutriculum, Strain RCC3387" /LENGTH=43 /DNA_ID= /DNA_START= /DNA_END= /DNA_ORIENTATION=
MNRRFGKRGAAAVDQPGEGRWREERCMGAQLQAAARGGVATPR